MKNLFISGLMFGLVLINTSWAKEESSSQSLGNTLKKTGDAAGAGMQSGGKAVAKDVSKVDSWLVSTVKKGGTKAEKAIK